MYTRILHKNQTLVVLRTPCLFCTDECITSIVLALIYPHTSKRSIYNIGLTIVDKLTKLTKIGFPMECFTADYSQFSIKIVKISLLGGRLVLTINSKHFRSFLKNS